MTVAGNARLCVGLGPPDVDKRHKKNNNVPYSNTTLKI